MTFDLGMNSGGLRNTGCVFGLFYVLFACYDLCYEVLIFCFLCSTEVRLARASPNTPSAR